jgi:nitroimidazol reductase NimA-like FMN-containing flavoprotein (pyridoxamine 5'-phosphate oxidase superfamily)
VGSWTRSKEALEVTSYPPTPRTRLNRLPARGSYDRAVVHGILDEALCCHVGFVMDGQPFVIPTIHARVGDTLYVHGAVASRMLSVMSQGLPLCVTITLVDGLVLARSAFHHSMNYRSVVILGTAREVTDPEERTRALDAIVEHVMPGRRAEVRPPNASELKRTRVLALPIEEASAKVRTGPPVDDEEDYAIPCWAGEIPLRLVAGAPVSDPRLAAGIAPPEAVMRYERSRRE